MAKMLGAPAATNRSCPYGCCTVYGKPCRRNLQPIKRAIKRREARDWEREADEYLEAQNEKADDDA